MQRPKCDQNEPDEGSTSFFLHSKKLRRQTIICFNVGSTENIFQLRNTFPHTNLIIIHFPCNSVTTFSFSKNFILTQIPYIRFSNLEAFQFSYVHIFSSTLWAEVEKFVWNIKSLSSFDMFISFISNTFHIRIPTRCVYIARWKL